MDIVDIGKMMRRGDDVLRLVVMAINDAELPVKVSKAIKQGAKELSCPKFLEAVQNQLFFETIYPSEALTDEAGPPTGASNTVAIPSPEQSNKSEYHNARPNHTWSYELTKSFALACFQLSRPNKRRSYSGSTLSCLLSKRLEWQMRQPETGLQILWCRPRR